MPDLDRPPFDRPPFDPGRIAVAVRQPPLDELYAVADRRRRRRIAGAAAGLVLLTIAAAAFAFAPQPVTPAGPEPGPSWQPDWVSGDMPSLFTMLSADTAVALWIEKCDVSIVATHDGGKTWGPFVLTPSQPAPCDRPDAFVLDERTYLAGQNLSTDAGMTWTAAVFTDVTQFPPNAKVIDCGSSRCFTHNQTPYAVDAAAGVVYRLNTKPEGRTFITYQQVDGVLWATLNGDESFTGVVARSTDSGRTWQTHPVPAKTGAEALVARDRDHATVTYLPDTDQPARFLTTADGGQTWQEVTSDLPPVSEIRSLVGGAGGALVLGQADPVRAWVSTDGGAHFTGVAPPRIGMDSPLVGGNAGRIWAVVSAPPVAYFTTDGRQWTTFPMPSR